ncbi:hypothetical protein QJS10_CPB11g01089 [Acorus calamus]|uniref:Uncharacterized protein n=1 Tax=Acorus calamus TaxID=4465 RepID=A0AAV9DW45_ACOCL|nr:hypothetical protein QJS10_CPB11g01089 [Acorus calamus]
MMGKVIEKAWPAMPVEIEGLMGLPMAGDDVIVEETGEGKNAQHWEKGEDGER